LYSSSQVVLVLLVYTAPPGVGVISITKERLSSYSNKTLHCVTVSIESKKLGDKNMYSTADERGIINNFSKEPQMYYAEYPANTQQRRYLVQGTLAAMLVSGFVLMSLVIS